MTTTATTARAEPPKGECAEIKATCTEALDSAERLIKDYAKALTAADLQIELQNKQITELEGDKLKAQQEANAWYRNPFLYLSVGAVLGAIAVK